MSYNRCIILSSLHLLLCLKGNLLFAQARLVFGASATYVNISNGGYLVVGDNTASAAPNTIDRTSGAGWIISEGAGGTANRVKWYIGNAAAASTYTVPFGRSTTNYIPLTLTIGSAGTAGGPFVFSTYETTDCTNSSYLPTLGTNPPTVYNCDGYGDASNYGVDRFWEINALGYGATKPDLSALRFYYINAEVTGITCANTGITESNLQAQRWNNSTNDWEAVNFLKGTSTPASDYVDLSGAGVVSGPNDLAKSQWWTMIDKTKPLPVEWLDVSAECVYADRTMVNVKWSTTTEQNSDFFAVERSFDGIHYSVIATVTAAGNSSTLKNYSIIDSDISSATLYYRIRETDFNGTSFFSKSISISSCFINDVTITGTVDGIVISVHALQEGRYVLEMNDALGKKILNQLFYFNSGYTQKRLFVSDISTGIYFVKIYNGHDAIIKKVFVQSSTH